MTDVPAAGGTPLEFGVDAPVLPGQQALDIPTSGGTRPVAIASRLCDWCRKPIPADARADAEVCGVVCRKRRWRFRRAANAGRPNRPASPRRRGTPLARPARFAYADPPYPGKSHLYRGHPDYAGEVDHAELVARLETGYPDGWALSTSAEALPAVLRLCPLEARVCVWRRRLVFGRSSRALNAWEPLIVVRGRPLDVDAVQDLLDVLEDELVVEDARDLETLLDYRGRYDSLPGALVGMKPPEFAVWAFRQLGAAPGDTLDDLYPGSGAVGRAWALYAQEPDLELEQAALDVDASPVDEGRQPSRRAAAPRDGSA